MSVGQDSEAVQRIREAIAATDGGAVYNVRDNLQRATIDFATFGGAGPDLIDRARRGEFGSSVVISTTTDEVVGGTLRYGTLGLPADADLFLAKVEIEQLIEESDPPVGVSSLDDDAGIFVRFRDMAAMRGDLLAREGDDILHIEINDRMDADAFAAWLARFDRLYKRRKDAIREKVIEVSSD